MTRVLCSLDDKIALNRRMAKTLEKITQALFQNWFVDFGPIRAPVDQNSSLPPPLTGPTPSRVSGSDDLPAGWRLAPLSAIATTARDTLDPVSLGHKPLLHLSLPAFDRGQRPTLEPASAVKSLKLVARRGMILFSKLNPQTPRIWIVPEETEIPMVASTEFIALTPAGATPASFLWSLLSSPTLIARASSMVTGTSKSHQRVQPASLMATEWPIPPSSVLAEFDALVAPMIARIEALRLQAVTLITIRDALLPKLISGKLQAGGQAALSASS
jgi:type I restriction enzyme S subunit